MNSKDLQTGLGYADSANATPSELVALRGFEPRLSSALPDGKEREAPTTDPESESRDLKGSLHPRECDCPENFGTDLSPTDKHHLIRCVHLDGKAVALIRMYDEFVVQRDETEEEKQLPVDDVVTVLWRGDSEAEALEAFYAAELELLRGAQ